ncbi:MAG: hypothetical protein ABIW49_12830 [Knoellia sp.]
MSRAHRKWHRPRQALLRREGEAALAVVLAVSLLAFGLPRVAGVSWRQIGDVLSTVTTLGTAVLTAGWLAGLWLHTIALSAALPGLNHRRAFFLNITGSAVSNVLPLGGRTESWARRAGELADRVVRRVDRRRPRGSSYASMAVTAQTFRGPAHRRCLGSAHDRKGGYAALQAVLLWLCLRLLGAHPPVAIVFATFAAERVLSLAVISPAATGIVELGMAGFLVASGVDQATAAGGVPLYRMFVVGMEVPVGGLLLAWWFGRRLVLRTRRLPRGLAHAVAGTNRRRPRQPSARS